MLFLGGMLILELWVRKAIEQDLVDHPNRNSEAVWTMESQIKGFQRGPVVETGLETILVIFKQRICLFLPLS